MADWEAHRALGRVPGAREARGASSYRRRSSSSPTTWRSSSSRATRPDFMGESVYEGLTVGYCYALTQFLMVFVLGIWYLRKSENEFDPLADAVAAAGPPRRRRGALRARRRAARGGRRDDPRSPKINVEALVIFGGRPLDHARDHVLGVQAGASAVGFYAAGRQITGRQNGLAISGDYLCAASFLGIAGLIFLYGFDGFLYSIGFLVAFLTVMFLLAERMRNAGKYTIADVLVVPPERDARARRGGARHVRRRDLLPDRADGRRGRADPGAGRDRLLARGDHHRRRSCSAT